MKDFFISYNRNDKNWAEWIAWVLEENGFSTIIQAWDFLPGGNFVIEMQKATTNTKKTIAVLSENYLNAEFTQPEWAEAFSRDPQGKDRVLIPIRITECSPKGLLSSIIYIDIVGLSEEDARKAILESLNGRRKPNSPISFPRNISSNNSNILPVSYPGITSNNSTSSIPKATLISPIIPAKNNGLKIIFTWVHLSDIHWGQGDKTQGFDREYIISQLDADIKKKAKEYDIENPNTIFVTGDIAFSGDVNNDGEYDKAKDWLINLGKILKVSEKEIYLVPGNHDVQRASNKKRDVFQVVDSIRSKREKLDDVLDEEKDAQLLLSRIEPYFKFSKQFAPNSKGVSIDQKTLCWVDNISLSDGLKICLIGLNTALLAQESKNKDKNKLVLGNRQLTRAFAREREENEIVIVLTHHPLDWLRDKDTVSGRIKGNAHLHLCGHVHKPNASRVVSGSGEDFITIVSGSAHQTEEEDYGYSFGCIGIRNDGQAFVRIWPRAWSKRNQKFQVDNNGVLDGKLYSELNLRFKIRNP